MKKLEDAIRSCGVSFKISQTRDANGKPIPGSYEWTALTRKHKLLVMQQLPGKMSTLVTPDILSTLVQIWNVSLHVCVHVHTVHIIDIDHNYFYRIFWPCTRSYQVRIPPQPKWMISFSKYVFMHILTHTRAHTHTHTHKYVHVYTHAHVRVQCVYWPFLSNQRFYQANRQQT